jgi:hypothetical protein
MTNLIVNGIQFEDVYTKNDGSITFMQYGSYHITQRHKINEIELMKLGELSTLSKTHPIIYFKYFSTLNEVVNQILSEIN